VSAFHLLAAVVGIGETTVNNIKRKYFCSPGAYIAVWESK
jgi:hypothetical protein